jgi:hypothetical protein
LAAGSRDGKAAVGADRRPWLVDAAIWLVICILPIALIPVPAWLII